MNFKKFITFLTVITLVAIMGIMISCGGGNTSSSLSGDESVSTSLDITIEDSSSEETSQTSSTENSKNV